MPRSVQKALVAMAAIVALSACTSAADRAGGRGFQDVTVLEIAQLNDVAPPQVQAYAAAVKDQSHGSLQLRFTDSWHKGEVDFEKHTLDDVTTGRVQGAWVGVPSLDLIGVTSFQPLLAPLLVDSQVVQSRIFAAGDPSRDGPRPAGARARRGRCPAGPDAQGTRGSPAVPGARRLPRGHARDPGRRHPRGDGQGPRGDLHPDALRR